MRLSESTLRDRRSTPIFAVKARFSERKGTPLFGCCLPEDKALDVIGHLADRNGVRATARRVGVTPNTVVRYARRLGEHARDLHDELVAFSPSDREVQLDEKWSYVFKKQEHCDPTDPADEQCGDRWDHTAYDPEHRLVLCVVPGARRRGGGGRGRRRQTADGGADLEAHDQ